MEMKPADAALREQYEQGIPELVWATGPSSYEYHFADRTLFDAIVVGSWHQPHSLFGADATTLAVEDGTLLGIEIGMPGPEYRTRQAGLGPVWQALIAAGDIDASAIPGVLERSEHAHWLNPALDDETYYIHALSVTPQSRGKRVGFRLIDRAIQAATDNGFKKLQLDVLSDNPAVGFYRSVGLELLAETTAPKPAAFGVPPEYRMGMRLG